MLIWHVVTYFSFEQWTNHCRSEWSSGSTTCGQTRSQPTRRLF